MKKGEHYVTLTKAGLPTPIYGVFDSSCLKSSKQNADLQHCIKLILTKGSQLIGVRTEPKANASSLGNYPHYMPLHSFQEVVDAISLNEKEHSDKQWWYLVNEAFVDYDWSAVLKVTQEGALPGHWLLDGEVNLTDNLPLRPALSNMPNVLRATQWKGNDAANIRKCILRSGLLDTWLEISKVRTPNGSRLVFWGVRNVPTLPKK